MAATVPSTPLISKKRKVPTPEAPSTSFVNDDDNKMSKKKKEKKKRKKELDIMAEHSPSKKPKMKVQKKEEAKQTSSDMAVTETSSSSMSVNTQSRSSEGSDSCFTSPDMGTFSAGSKSNEDTTDNPDISSPVMSLTKTAHVCDVEGWTQEDLICLLDAIKEQLPTHDKKSYITSLKKINWDKITVKNFSGKECMDKYMSLHVKVRHIRSLTEIIEDIYHIDKVLHPERGEPPKKPNSAYFKFLKDFTAKCKKKGIPVNQSTASKAYTELSEKKKKKYEDSFRKDSEKFKEEMKKYMLENPGVNEKKGKTHDKIKHKHRERERPPSQISAHQLYINHQVEKAQAKDPHCDKKKIAEESRKKWHELMKDKKKLKWINKALECDKEYQEKMDEYCKKHPDYSAKPSRSVLTKAEKRMKDKADGKPEKPLGGFTIFTSENLAKLSDWPANQRMAENARCWRELSPEKKQKYKDKAAKAKRKYEAKYKSYLNSLTQEERTKILNEAKAKQLTVKKKKGAGKLADKNQVKITNFYKSQEQVDSDSESEMSDVIPLTQATVKSHSDTQSFTKMKRKSASSSSSSSSSSSESSKSESSDEDEGQNEEQLKPVTPENHIATKTPSPTTKTPSPSSVDKTPSQSQSTADRLPPKTPRPVKKELAESDSSDSSSDSESESDSGSESSEGEEEIQMSIKAKSPAKPQGSPFTASLKSAKKVSSSDSDSDSKSGSDSSSSEDEDDVIKPSQRKQAADKPQVASSTVSSKSKALMKKKKSDINVSSPMKTASPMKRVQSATPPTKKPSPMKKASSVKKSSPTKTSSPTKSPSKKIIKYSTSECSSDSDTSNSDSDSDSN